MQRTTPRRHGHVGLPRDPPGNTPRGDRIRVVEPDIGCGHLRVVLPKRSGIDMVDEGQSMAPLGLIGETFREDVSPHTLGLFINETVARLLETLMEPMDANTVCATQMTHGRVLACAANLDHRRVIVMDNQDNVSLKQDIP